MVYRPVHEEDHLPAKPSNNEAIQNGNVNDEVNCEIVATWLLTIPKIGMRIAEEPEPHKVWGMETPADDWATTDSLPFTVVLLVKTLTATKKVVV